MEHTYICMYINAVVNSVWVILITTVFKIKLYKGSVPTCPPPPKLLGAHLILSHDSASLLPFLFSLFSFLLVKRIHLAAQWRSVVLRLSKLTKSEFAQRKYQRGHALWKDSRCWAVSESRKTFLVPVLDRTADTLMAVVSAWMVRCTTVISDYWAVYQDLEAHGCTHHNLNHSIAFVDERPGAHTNMIEITWRRVKAFINPYSWKREYIYHLIHFMFAAWCRSEFHHIVVNMDYSLRPHSTSKMSLRAFNLPHICHHASTSMHLYWAIKKHASATSHSRDPQTKGKYFLSRTNTCHQFGDLGFEMLLMHISVLHNKEAWGC